MGMGFCKNRRGWVSVECFRSEGCRVPGKKLAGLRGKSTGAGSVFGEGFCRAKYGGEGITGVRLSCLWRWLGQWSSGCRKVGRRWQG